MSKHLTNQTRNEIIKTYLSKPMTLSELSSISGYSIPTLIKVLDDNHISRYSRTKLFSPNINESFFECIDTEEKAYFLGLILADGCVYTKKNKHLLSITLKDEDAYIIERFIEAIHSNRKLTGDGRGCSEIQIHSEKMVNDLAKYGIVDNKSLNTIMPHINNTLMCHFVRGVFDGDGNANFAKPTKRRHHKKTIRFCQGSYIFLEELKTTLHKQTGTTIPNTFKEKENLWSISYGSNQDMTLLIEYMYENATIKLERKWLRCKLILEEILMIHSHDNTEITRRCKNLLAS